MLEEPHQELAQQLLGCRYEELTPVQRSVIDLIANETPTGIDPKLKHDERSFGDRLADPAKRLEIQMALRAHRLLGTRPVTGDRP